MEQLKPENHLLAIVERDSEGNEAGIFYINRNQVLSGAYSCIEDRLDLMVSGLKAQVGPMQVPILDKYNKKTGGLREGIGTKIDNVNYTITERPNIVAMHNYLTGESCTEETFIGFQLHDTMVKKIKEARLRKVEEEKKLTEKQRNEKYEKELGVENYYRKESNQPSLSMAEFKAFKQQEEQYYERETGQFQGGQAPGAKGAQGTQNETQGPLEEVSGRAGEGYEQATQKSESEKEEVR